MIKTQAGETYYLHTSNLDPVDAGLASKELVKIRKYTPADLEKVDLKN